MSNLILSSLNRGTSFDTGIDTSQVNAIPGLSKYLQDYYNLEGLATEVGMKNFTKQLADRALSDPVAFEKNLLNQQVQTLYRIQNWRDIAPPPDKQATIDAAKNAINYLAQNKVSASDINSIISQAGTDYSALQQQYADKIASMNAADGTGGLSQVAQVAIPIAVAYYLPSAGKEIGALLDVGTAVGTAIASTAYQMSTGVDFDTAVKNATVNAITQTGSQTVAKDIADTVGKVGADAIASAGGSIASTLAKGGSTTDAFRNAGAALVAVGVTSATDDRVAGAAVGGAITGGATGAALGAASELGKPTSTDKGTQIASAGDITQDPSVVSDSPTSDLGEIVVTAPRDNVQIVSPDIGKPATPSTTPTTPTTPVTDLGEITVTAPKDKTTTDVGEITVTAPKDKTTTDVGEITVTAPKESEVSTAAKTPTSEKDPTEKTAYDPNLFIYSSKSPLSQALRLDMTTPSFSLPPAVGSEALSQALRIGDAGEPIFGGSKKGKKSGWNVESLRYMNSEA